MAQGKPREGPAGVSGPGATPTPTEDELKAVAELIDRIDRQQDGLQVIFDGLQRALLDFRQSGSR